MEITQAQSDMLLNKWDNLNQAAQRIQIVQADQVSRAAATLEAERLAFRAAIFEIFSPSPCHIPTSASGIEEPICLRA